MSKMSAPPNPKRTRTIPLNPKVGPGDGRTGQDIPLKGDMSMSKMSAPPNPKRTRTKTDKCPQMSKMSAMSRQGKGSHHHP
jgi:hypothetical protein